MERLSERLSDIPMLDVMERMGYGRGEEKGGLNLFRDDQGRVAMMISAREQKALDDRGRPLCTNSLDLVVRMRQHNEQRADFNHADGVRWLAQEFGEGRATAALVVNREHWAAAWFGRERQLRDLGRPDRGAHEPDRGGVGHHDHDRGHDRPTAPDRGGPSFGR